MIELIECVDLKKLEAALTERGYEAPSDLNRLVADALSMMLAYLNAQKHDISRRKYAKITNTAEISSVRKDLFQEPTASVVMPGWSMSLTKYAVHEDSQLPSDRYGGLVIRGWNEGYFKPKKVSESNPAIDLTFGRIVKTISGRDGGYATVSFEELVKSYPASARKQGLTPYLVFATKGSTRVSISTSAEIVRLPNTVSVPTYLFSRNVLLFDRRGYINVAKCGDDLLIWNSTFFLWMEAA